MTPLELALDDRRKQLIAAQMEFWPDSRIMTLGEVYAEWMDEGLDVDELIQEFKTTYRGIYNNDELVYMNQFIIKRRADHQLRIARSLAMCLQSPVNVFYECGMRLGDMDESGVRAPSTYRWRGCRYGTEGHEYISGFGRF